jgi:hypothetical protein
MAIGQRKSNQTTILEMKARIWRVVQGYEEGERTIGFDIAQAFIKASFE